VKRTLSGSLKHLAPTALLRLVSATSPSGVLELVTDAGSLRLEVIDGRIPIPRHEELRHAGQVLRCADGAFRFEPCELRPIEGDALTLTAFAEAAQATERGVEASFAADIDVDRLIAGDIVDLAQPAKSANIHVLPQAPLENPLDELLSDLEATAPGELLLTQIGIVAQDPRIWRGTLESGWRRRGWKIQIHRSTDEVMLDDLDVLVLHQDHAIENADLGNQWLALVRRAVEHEPIVPVVWVGRITDPAWVNRLIEAGIGFLMPSPNTQRGGVVLRFAEVLAMVLDRQLRVRQMIVEPAYPSAVCELVDALLHGADSDQAVGSLLQLAADDFMRGAVLMVEETAFRCRAGFGYPLNRGTSALPRGVGILEKTVRGGDAIMGIDPASAGAMQLARVLGVETLPSHIAVVPLGTGAAVGGLLVVDREGQPLPDLRDIALLACCLGGIVMRTDAGSTVQIV
jgi:hypothetical protein